ncbi:hypothetical protein [Effusibacillus lacus]|uniref:Serine protease n=1 Tax=Effusibacillus lacus TaxID=1348429 RepID=A0A292YCS6_9BACL|nr:hypothetical protein [Effusibacillus lacus]TCS73647.1 hypothetical protein EDD64_11760 [Effusibacillus lacus]GAX89462.1 hypothetical protein [Effusibacillus lacus]
MKQVQEIENQIAELAYRLQVLKDELEQIRKTCVHEFIKDTYTQTCAKCNLTESLYY